MRRLGFFAVTALLLALSARGDDWSSLGRDDARARAAAEAIAAPAPLGPPLALGAETVASPVASDGFLVTASLDGQVRAFRENDRSPLWSVPLGGPILATPAVDKGRVFVSCSAGTLTVLRLADGAALGTVTTNSADQSSPAISGGRIYRGTGYPTARVSALDVNTQAPLWSAQVEQVTNSSPALAGGLLIIGCNSGRYSAFDAASGAPAWNFPTAASAGFSSPFVDGASAYLPSGATLHRVDLDPLQWGSSNWSVTCVDPAPAPGAIAVETAASSPVKVDGMILYLVRFVYVFDLDHDGNSDQRILHEFVCGVNPATHGIGWQNLLGSITVPDVNGVPPYALCPTPAVTGTLAVVASSVDASLRILAGADGSEAAAFPLDAACLASPIVANARLYALTRAGTLYTFEGTTPQPASATGLTPDGASFTVTPTTLSWNSAGAGATYRVRIASDGEILMNYDYEFVTNSTSIPCPTLPTQHVYEWGVRVQNSALAYAPWTLARFKVNVPPAPPSSLVATPQHGKVLLSWTASPSPSTVGYRVDYGPSGGPLGSVANPGNVTSTTISGLSNGTSYTFDLRAVDALPDYSTPITAVATPVSGIHIGGTAFDTLEAAIAAALPGQTILLGADTFVLDTTAILPNGVQLRGVSALDTRIVASGPILMLEATAGSSVQLLSLSGGAVGVRATGDGATIRNCVIRGMSDAGIEVLGTAQILNNTIVGNAVAGVRASGLTQARNNIVQQNGVGLLGIIVSRHNDVSDGYVVCVPGPGDLQSPVAFLDAASGDYREQALQPSLDAGNPSDDYSQEPALNGGRINMGAFGNTPLAAASLTAGPPSSGPPKSSSGGGCGLLGLEIVLLLMLRRRR